MTFLQPAAMLLAAGLSVPALLLFYLLKLRRRPVRISSTLLWQRAVKDFQANTPFARLRFTLLLLVQLLILACLLLAVGRPAVPGSGVDARRVVLLIDRSASMNALDGMPPPATAGARPTPRVSRLDRARELARSIVRDAPGDQQIMVVQFAVDAQALTSMTTDRTAALEAIDAIEPTDEPGDIHAAIELVQAIAPPVVATEAQGEGVERAAVVLLSDGSFAPAPRGSPGSLPSAVTGLDVRYLPVGAAGPSRDNAGIVALGARRDFDDPATVRLFLRLRNVGPAPLEVALTVTLDDRTVLARTATIPASSATTAGAPSEPGELPLTLAFRDTLGGLATVEIARTDLLLADNRAVLVLPPPAKPRLLLVAPGAQPAQADASLRSILESLEHQSLRQLDAAGYEAAVAAGAISRDTPGDAGTDVVVFDRVRPTRLPPVPSLSFGAGLPASPAPAGSAAAPGPIEIIAAPNAPATAVDRFIAWKRDHPIMRFVNPDAVVISPPVSIAFDETLPDGTRAGEVLASSATGPIIVARRDGRSTTQASGGAGSASALRRVVVAFALGRSSWPEHVSFLAFVSNTIDDLALRADGQAGRAALTGQPLLARAGPGADAITVTAPSSAAPVTIPIPAADIAPGGGAEVPIGRAARAGVFRLTGTMPADAALAVNLLDATETDLRVQPALELGGGSIIVPASTLGPSAAGAGDPAAGGGGGAGVGGLGGYRELWWHFVLAALVLLCIEWPLYALAARR